MIRGVLAAGFSNLSTGNSSGSRTTGAARSRSRALVRPGCRRRYRRAGPLCGNSRRRDEPGTGTLVSNHRRWRRVRCPGNVRQGQSVVHVTKPGFVGTRFSLTSGTTNPFGVTAGQQIDMRDLRLPRAGVVSGRVSDGFGDPVADIAVVAWRVEYLTPARRRIVSRASFQTNDLGEFRAHGLEPGKYSISAGRSVAGLKEAPTFYTGARCGRLFHSKSNAPGGDSHAVPDALVSLTTESRALS